jgi:gentisate 1,2-dioxygenase
MDAAADKANNDLARYSEGIRSLNAKPLWERTTRMAPGTPAVSAIWRYRDMRPQLLRAADLISTEQAERRVLMLENPGCRSSGRVKWRARTAMHRTRCGLFWRAPAPIRPSKASAFR